ncbi:MAG: tyrosine-type recombinase/integrase [Cyanobacteria bacterium P01_H01_bin.15]
MAKLERTAKGCVSITVDKERLRLGWRFQGKRFYLYLGLPDTQINRKVAEAKAAQIELDIKAGHFDRTLKTYRPDNSTESSLTAIALFEKFIQHKAKTVAPNTLDKYRALLSSLKEHFGQKHGVQLSEREVEKFTAWYQSQSLSKTVIKERLGLLKACWQWGIKKGLLEENPWEEMPNLVKVPPKQMPKPFTREEIERIIEAFRCDRYYRCYADFVEFRFGTGCRTGELIGLQWKHVSDDCSTVWIGESLVKGNRKATKTNRARTISLPAKLQTMLWDRKELADSPDSLIFTGPKGAPIQENNFARRAWRKILERLDIDYRKPYYTRHTLVSHALDMGMNPVEVAHLTGHDVQTLYENYAGVVSSRPRLPEL